MSSAHHYDVIVIGGGHAGIEAATASARVGAKTLLLTLALDQIGTMSCNPAIGGVAKGQLAREVDALGGCMGQIIDRTGLHFRMLNTSKGPAVMSPRAQADKDAYRRVAKQMVEATEHLSILQGEVAGLLIEAIPEQAALDKELRDSDGRYRHPPSVPTFRVKGVRTGYGLECIAPRVVVTTGTFLGGKLHFGEAQLAGGRAGESAALELTDSLTRIGLRTGRLKTGTPPRIAGASINFEACEAQPSDPTPCAFSFETKEITGPMRDCFITYTNQTTMQIITDNLERSPVYSGQIAGKGPRYCPSIEDKAKKFPDRQEHQIFLEPEGLNTEEYYANGISSSLPYDVQDAFVASIPGLENAHITRYGYAVEYDFVPPHQCHRTLACRSVDGLYMAGQICGTTGYEEAAAQGVVAGANAALSLAHPDDETMRLLPQRDQAYVGVLVDDLTTRSTDEPYRMFTSLAEFRLRLRQDNADRRLTPIAGRLGLVTQERAQRVAAKEAAIGTAIKALSKKFIDGSGQSLLDKLRRPDVKVVDLIGQVEELSGLDAKALEQVEIDAKYAGYLERQDREVAKLHRLEGVKIPSGIDFAGIAPMRLEAREKFAERQPETLGQASRIAGISPADIGVLEVYLRSQSGAS